MPVQPSLAQLDLSELEKAIPQEIRSVVLVSNADLHLTTTSLQLIQQLGPCLFIHHNHAHNATTLRQHYPKRSCEMLFIRGNGIGYWGLVESIGATLHQRSREIPHCGTFALRGKLDISARDDITKINLAWLTALEQQEKYPEGKRPSTGFYTRKLFAAIAERRTDLKVYTLGFQADGNYWNAKKVTHHDYIFESQELLRSEHQRLHSPLDQQPHDIYSSFAPESQMNNTEML